MGVFVNIRMALRWPVIELGISGLEPMNLPRVIGVFSATVTAVKNQIDDYNYTGQ